MSTEPGKAVNFEYEINYSAGYSARNFLLAVLILVLTALPIALQNYWSAALGAGVAVLLVLQGVKRARRSGPALKIGQAGLWTAPTGFRTWRQVWVRFEASSTNTGANMCLVVVPKRPRSSAETCRLNVDDLAIDFRDLQALLKKHTSD
ncbi:hypothetical protein [Hymenobacter sp. B81]|uniref:hypothetical protein n=1 Tax=Hymenobacter sp. B81 TaxID=3344878 RepID=UPI0037DDE07A